MESYEATSAGDEHWAHSLRGFHGGGVGGMDSVRLLLTPIEPRVIPAHPG